MADVSVRDSTGWRFGQPLRPADQSFIYDEDTVSRIETPSVLPDKNGLVEVYPGSRRYVEAAFRDGISPHRVLAVGDVWYERGENSVYYATDILSERRNRPEYQERLRELAESDKRLAEIKAALAREAGQPEYRVKSFFKGRLTRFLEGRAPGKATEETEDTNPIQALTRFILSIVTPQHDEPHSSG